MTIYYVSKAGSDSTEDGSDNETPYLTIGAALAEADSTGDIVDIGDEGVYVENNLGFAAASVSVQHTASDIGRARISGNASAGHAFALDAYAGGTLIGLEVGFYTDYVFNKVGSGYNQVHLSGCFIHNVPQLGSHAFVGIAGRPVTVEQSVLFFEPASNEYCIATSGYMEISNCLITSSTSVGTYNVLRDYEDFGTASFSTIINRGVALIDPIVRFAKVINCIVTGSGGDGIASDDHTYNLVHVQANSASFRNLDDDDDGSAGTGEISGREARFVDGDAVGGWSEATTAENYRIGTTSDALLIAGTAFDGIIVDLTGSTRLTCLKPTMGCFERSYSVWTEHEDEAYDSFEGDFTINDNKNLSSNYKYGNLNCENPKQPPFSKGIKGPANLRGRTKAYVTSNGGNPKEISN